MNDAEENILRNKLLQYPGATAESIEQEIELYKERESTKNALTMEQKFSNYYAEKYLDKKGYPRPPGWRSVFFYPGGTLPRLRYIALVIVAAIVWIVFG